MNLDKYVAFLEKENTRLEEENAHLIDAVNRMKVQRKGASKPVQVAASAMLPETQETAPAL